MNNSVCHTQCRVVLHYKHENSAQSRNKKCLTCEKIMLPVFQIALRVLPCFIKTFKELELSVLYDVLFGNGNLT